MSGVFESVVLNIVRRAAVEHYSETKFQPLQQTVQLRNEHLLLPQLHSLVGGCRSWAQVLRRTEKTVI